MAEEISVADLCELGNATAGLCEINDSLSGLTTGVNTFFLIWAVSPLLSVPQHIVRLSFPYEYQNHFHLPALWIFTSKRCEWQEVVCSLRPFVTILVTLPL